jgi:hypothetical protein
MTTQEQQPANETVDHEILQEIGNIRKELIGVKRLVLTELIDMKRMLTTLTNVLLPEPPRATTLTGTGDTVLEPTTGEDSPSEFVRPGASLTDESVPTGQETPDQAVFPDDQQTSTARGTKDEDEDGTGQ